MPELDGSQIVAIASFLALVVAWLVAPNGSTVKVESKLGTAAAAAD